MNLKITDGTLGVRPPVTKPHPGFLTEIGEERFRKLVDDHYNLIPKSSIAFMFPLDEEDFEEAKLNAADFLVQISGGEDYFNRRRGQPRMVGRHAPFRIDEESRKVWLNLYKGLLEELQEEGLTAAYIESFWEYLEVFSKWMVNTPSK